MKSSKKLLSPLSYKGLCTGAILIVTTAISSAQALEIDDVIGTWKLVSSTRKILATGEVSDTFGAHPSGWIIYEKNGRMLSLIVSDSRPRPSSIDAMTDQDRIKLFRTMSSYSGTYSLVGNTITHKVDTSWNEVWTGTSVIRDIEVKGDKLIYTQRPAPSSSDGRMSVVTLVWEKVR